ncbi:MAG: M67 family metallopeptidase [Chloroflexi bacterium]|nr:M67 family metallopeptidase [Chloroflexota bacterium]
MITLPRRFADEIIAHARGEEPNECCGVLAGRDGVVTKVYRVTNAEHSPYRYNMDSREFFQVMRDVEKSGWEMWGFYHSHTHTPAYPSQTDRNLASWPDSYYLILSLEDKQAPVLRAFRIINGGDVAEHPITIEP